ncbi:MAG: D-alanyl-D-alanine carboxypeptidase [Clostridia bacterium]|jgi:D-alanyl-D-alanine carboxypeptidase|nr:D-alanyl-D-alanine carboxypeptidase [Clostridia bacterium]
MYKKHICFLWTLLSLCFSINATPLPLIHADGAILLEPKTNTVLYAKNISQTFYPASTTKVLTSLILLEDMPIDTLITKTKTSVDEVPSDSSQIGISTGTQYTALEGLHAILLASDNYVSYDMAVKDAGSIEAFAAKMNQKAESLGAFSSHFMNPHGYHHPSHYTTPFDLSQIAKAAFNIPLFTQIAGVKSHTFMSTNPVTKIPISHTALLFDEKSSYYNPYVIGAKTGFHTPAKRTLIAKAKYDNIELIGVIMRTDNPLQFQDMNALLEYGHQNYSLIENTPLLPSLVNHSYSRWAKPYVDFAVDNNWLIDPVKNYTENITRREFVTLLKKALPNHYESLLNAFIQYDGPSIYKENLPADRKDMALISYRFLSELGFNSDNAPITSSASDIDKLSADYQQAITFNIRTGLMGENHAAFDPDSLVTYEQAISIAYRLHDIITRYDANRLPIL